MLFLNYMTINSYKANNFNAWSIYQHYAIPSMHFKIF